MVCVFSKTWRMVVSELRKGGGTDGGSDSSSETVIIWRSGRLGVTPKEDTARIDARPLDNGNIEQRMYSSPRSAPTSSSARGTRQQNDLLRDCWNGAGELRLFKNRGGANGPGGDRHEDRTCFRRRWNTILATVTPPRCWLFESFLTMEPYTVDELARDS